MLTNKKLFNRHVFVSLLVITLLGAFLRFYKLISIPPGFFADEASIGYNAYTLLRDSSDEEGRKLPILFKNFGDFYRPGVSVYITAPFAAVFGLNEWSVRAAAASVGTISILLIFFLTRLLFASNMVALSSSFFLAISPWHIHMSRIGQEFVYLPFFVMFSIFLFVYGFQKKSKTIQLASFALVGTTLYTYVTAYFLVPLLIISLIIIYSENLLKNKKIFICGLFITFVISIPLIVGIPSGKTFSRFRQVSSTNATKSYQEITNGVVRTYLDHFSPSFLFIDGDIGYQGHFITRFSVKGMGQLYLYQLPLIISGLVYLARKFNKSAALLLTLVLIYPLGSTFAPFADGGGPFATRSVLGLVPLHILTGIGTYYIFSYLKQNSLKFLFTVFLIVSTVVTLNTFLLSYYKEYPVYAANYWGWQFGVKEIMQMFIAEKNYYDELYLEGKFNAPNTLIQFYDPENYCQGKCLVGEVDKYDPHKKQLFAFTPELIQTISDDFTFYTKAEVYYPNGSNAFLIGELYKKDTF